MKHLIKLLSTFVWCMMLPIKDRFDNSVSVYYYIPISALLIWVATVPSAYPYQAYIPTRYQAYLSTQYFTIYQVYLSTQYFTIYKRIFQRSISLYIKRIFQRSISLYIKRIFQRSISLYINMGDKYQAL